MTMTPEQRPELELPEPDFRLIDYRVSERSRRRLAEREHADWHHAHPDRVCDRQPEQRRAEPGQARELENPWLERLVKAEQENHCGDAACMTRRVSAAIRVLTGGKGHQDYCWAIETFEVELGIRDPETVGAEPSDAMLDAARAARAALDTTPDPPVARLEAALTALSMEADERRAYPDEDQWVAVGIDIAVDYLRALLRSPQERSGE